MENKNTGMMPYDALRNAIVIQAAEDYRKAVEVIRESRAKLKELWDEYAKLQGKDDVREQEILKDIEEIIHKLEKARSEINEIESFFRSEWYSSICSVDGEWMIEQLREEAGDYDC